MNIKQKWLTLLIVVVIAIILVLYNINWAPLHYLGIGALIALPSIDPIYRLQKPPNDSFWIVATTSSQISEACIKTLVSASGWNVLLVGEGERPGGCFPDYCHYINPSIAQSLPFTTAKLLKKYSYSLKTLGYLLAIQRGAKFIYDTDELEPTIDFNYFNYFRDRPIFAIQYTGPQKIFNSCKHFGQPILKPRGFPLHENASTRDDVYKISKFKVPLIQQGLINGDPDIDEIFKSTLLSTAGVIFDQEAPSVIVPFGIFSPYSSKNTLFLYDAFWSLALPMTSTKAHADIIRGYWGQRLMWEIGGNVAFYPPNTARAQNSKGDYDYDVPYFKSSRLIKFLSAWKCPQNRTFYECIDMLSKDMLDQRFWEFEDYELVKSWLVDLVNVSYNEPNRTTISGLKKTSSAVIYNPVAGEKGITASSSKWKQVLAITNFCKQTSYELSSASFNPVSYHSILLIVVFNHPFYDNIPYIHLMYSVKFDHIVYCGSEIGKFKKSSKTFSEKVTFIERQVKSGLFAHECITGVMKMNYNVKGYLMIGDDTLLNSWNLHFFPKDKIWFHQFINLWRHKRNTWWWWDKEYGQKPFNKAWAGLMNLKNDTTYGELIANFTTLLQYNSGSSEGLFRGCADILYIPQRFQEHVIYFMDHFSKYDVFMELVIPTVLLGLSSFEDVIKLRGQYLWLTDRDHVPERFNPDDIFMHPVKLSQIKSNSRPFFCKTIFPLILQGHQSQQYNTKLKRDSVKIQ